MPAPRSASRPGVPLADPWAGPQTDFREANGLILGPWWQGGGPAAVYFTGPHSQKNRHFEKAGRTVAALAGRPYLEIHKEDLLPSEADLNGILAYPDGTARVRLCLMAGGNSALTMCELAGIDPPTPEQMKAQREKFAEARKVPQAAFRTGMNYVGACAGFFTATSGYEVPRALHTGWGLWPGKVRGIGPGMNPPFPDVVFAPAESNHPLVKAVPGGTLKAMYYNGGPLGVVEGVPDTEYLGKYQGGNMPEIVGDWFLVCYKPKDDLLCGRCVIATGHPEVAHGDFFVTAMALHAVDREYEVRCRALLPGEPIRGVSGDDQVQYFSLEPKEGQALRLTLTGLDDNCDLYLRAGLPPTFRLHDQKSARPGLADETLTVPRARNAIYYVAVHGRHSVANGAKYTLTWERD